MGTKVLVNLKPHQRSTWSYHAEDGWYVGPYLHHYRCMKCFIPASGKARDVDTLQLFQKQFLLPQQRITYGKPQRTLFTYYKIPPQLYLTYNMVMQLKMH